MKFLLKILFFSFLFLPNISAQSSSDLIYVDSSGRMRWTINKEEAYFFGVNYSTPFAFSYRALKDKSISHKEIIDLDIQQFNRLGLNAYRIHVWDREVSDREGNLIENEHIELLDYLISKLIENNIYIILTPIAWWGTGWPEPDIETTGFSTFYSKIESTTKPEVLKAHVNYLKQFVNHKNSYTGKTYRDEDYIIGFEIFNEPNLSLNKDSVTNYVNTTVKALRDVGITKPIFFNISENPGKEQWEGVASSNIEGISFQWYPTGLVKYSELKGNFLPNVLSYPLPDHTEKIKNKAKIVYEFDAADIGKSYMYPVMAHSFKEAGMQWATMFCYDPTSIAQYNSEYSTHFLNLLYTPQKALSFLISAYLFNKEEISPKKIDNSSVIMSNVLVDYNMNLSLLNTSERFYYSNNNETSPVDIKQLKHIAGYGNSKLINYDGRGTYFLDEVNNNVWKLELFPDAVWIKNPFGRNGLDELVAKLLWKSHKMKINLPDLNPDFKIYSDNENFQAAVNYTVKLEPGVYFITNDKNFSITNYSTGNTDFEMIKEYGEFINDFQSTEIKNLTPSAFNENEEKKIVIEIYCKEENLNPAVYITKPGWRNYQKIQFVKSDDFIYEFILPKEILLNGVINYFVAINNDNEILTFPGRLNISPEFWSFNPGESFKLSILPPSDKILVYNPETDADNLITSNIWRFVQYGIDYTFDEDYEQELSVVINKVREKFSELAMQFYIGEYLKNIKPGVNDKLNLEMKSTSEDLDSITVKVLYDNTTGFERTIPIKTSYENLIIPLSQPEKFKFALLPRPYPTFLPYWFESIPQSNKIKSLKLESIQISIPLPELDEGLNNYGIKLKKIYLIKTQE
ncbi:MAG: hypothetical protein A2V93_08035 [Ignavibacteria bacterium RBG_16_34_14]|nr:MAG: hypothetical protein A2V93_08035 [Ignavibacteria bacterium RBG_16_34_14]